jgi:hypothetical protein
MMRINPRSRASSLRELSAQLISNAAFVAYEGQKAKSLISWLAKDNARKVIYFFDTDLIKTWCAPWQKGPVDAQTLGNGYGQVLPQRLFEQRDVTKQRNMIVQERREAEAVAWLLASRALGEAIRRKIPILQTTAHFEETLRVYARVKSLAAAIGDVSNVGGDSRFGFQLSSILKALANNLESREGPFGADNAGAVISNILQLIDERELNRASGPIREWDAFMDLIRIGNGLFKFSEFTSDDENLNGVLEGLSTIDGAVDALRLTEAIDKALRHAKSGFSAERAEVDLSAVAEVVSLTQLLRANGTNVRIVLLTGDRALVTAMSEAKDVLPGMDMTIADFAFEHVRHLWSFVDIGDAVIEGGEEQSKELFSGLLTFQEETKSIEDFLKVLRGYAVNPTPEYVERVGQREVDDAFERWQGYVGNATDTQKHYLFDSRKEAEITTLILHKLHSAGKGVERERLLAIVRETTARARDRANVEFSEIGASSLLDRHKNGVRNPPDLMFDSLPITDKIFKDLALPRRVFQKAIDFSERFSLITEDCYRPYGEDDDDYRQECYLKYLVLGALFASANRWMVAEQHAESAVRIVERSNRLGDPIKVKQGQPGQARSHMSGREAYFLLASSKRIRSTNERQYRDAMDVLLRARACLDEDRKRGTGLGVPFIRFDSEALALALGRYYTARRAAHEAKKDRDSDVDPCDDLADEVYIAARSLIEVREEMRLADGNEAANKGDRLKHIPVGTRANIATNLLQVYVVSQYRVEEGYIGSMDCPVDRDEMAAALDVLIDETNLVSSLCAEGFAVTVRREGRDPAVVCSPLMLLYAVVGDLLIDSARLAVLKTQDDVDKVFAKYEIAVTRYDEWRFKALRSFASKMVARNLTSEARL